MPKPVLGAHASVAGGLHLALERGERLGCDAIQIFVKNPNQWRQKSPTEAQVEAFREGRERSPIRSVVAHASYLINLAARDRSILERSRRALVGELVRCNRLGVDGLVLHPGAHMGRGEGAGLKRIADSIRRVEGVFTEREARRGRPIVTRLLLENTAGQGTVLGYRFGQLGEIVERAGAAGWIGVCLDTCHAFAAGYPLHRVRGLSVALRRLREAVGPAEPSCIHLNDSQRPFESRRDRHAGIGAGEIGEGLFRRLVRNRSLSRTPMILETPLGPDGRGHERDLARLRSLLL